MKYHREIKNEVKAKQLESELLAMGSIALSSGESSDNDSEDDSNTPNIGDEICLETLTGNETVLFLFRYKSDTMKKYHIHVLQIFLKYDGNYVFRCF